MVGYLARHGRPEQGRGRVGTCAGGGPALLALTRWGKPPPGARKAVHFWPHDMASPFLLRRGKRLPIDASQSAPASGLESAVGAADPTGDPGWPALPPRGPTHQRAATLGELQRQHQLAVTLAGGRVGTWPRPAQGVGGGRVWCLARGHPSPHPSQLNVTLSGCPPAGCFRARPAPDGPMAQLQGCVQLRGVGRWMYTLARGGRGW